jgi:arsenate reductase
MMLFIEYPKCTTCQKARAWLEAQHCPFTARHIKECPPTRAELEAWWQRSHLPLKRFFNTSGMLYKQLNLSTKLATLSEAEQLDLLATDGMLVKRPLLVTDQGVFPGFKPEIWQQLLTP